MSAVLLEAVASTFRERPELHTILRGRALSFHLFTGISAPTQSLFSRRWLACLGLVAACRRHGPNTVG
jgi:hypothetical protein